MINQKKYIFSTKSCLKTNKLNEFCSFLFALSNAAYSINHGSITPETWAGKGGEAGYVPTGQFGTFWEPPPPQYNNKVVLHAMKDIRKGIRKEQTHNSTHSLTSTIHEGDWSASHSGTLILTTNWRLGGPQSRYERSGERSL